jgi:endogenous inhibitor of DNA gyrase (YacG/DUF329 family)
MNCIICGKEIEKSQYMHKTLCSSKCFNIDFWNDCLDEEAIIIDGTCYHDGGKTNSSIKGFGGRTFKIQTNDGRIIETDNLWFNGEVPKERNVKDNAVFI